MVALSLLMIAVLGAQGKGQEKGGPPARGRGDFYDDRRVIAEY